ncbi:MAG: hypothetical protein ACLRY7_08760 [Hominenteromicrobium sp.]|uniref:hypothetical protein n=1 Tax=Hominenteromicrobium sp. TaxID=3073581 RepID=UPI0039A283FC
MKKLLINKKNVTLVIGIAVVMPLLSLMNVQMSVQFGAVIDRMQITSVFIRSLLALIVITALTYFFGQNTPVVFSHALVVQLCDQSASRVDTQISHDELSLFF